MVFNYDIPLDNEYYVHRIGRTGRAGRSGKAVSFASGRKQNDQMKTLERYIKTKIPFRGLPSQREVEKIEQQSTIDSIKAELEKKVSENQRNIINSLIGEGFEAEQIAATLLRMMSAKPEVAEKIENTTAYKNTGAERGMVRFFINLGKKDRIQPKDIVGCIAGEAKIRGSEIGKIDIFEQFSFVEVPLDRASMVQDALGGAQLKGRSMNIEPAKGR